MIRRIWLKCSKGCFLKVKGQNFDIFGSLDHFSQKLTSIIFSILASKDGTKHWTKMDLIELL